MVILRELVDVRCEPALDGRKRSPPIRAGQEDAGGQNRANARGYGPEEPAMNGDGRILLGKGRQSVHLLTKYGNRHGLVAGATGTGKTLSLMVLAEGFSRAGVPVFLADVKGDVAGLAMAG